MCKAVSMWHTCGTARFNYFFPAAIKHPSGIYAHQSWFWQRNVVQLNILLRAVCLAHRESGEKFHNRVTWPCLPVQPMKVMRPNPFCCTIFTSQHSKLWSAPVGLFGQTAGCSSTVRRCYELWCSSQSWFLHLGLVEMNRAEHTQTNAFVPRGQSRLACRGLALTHTQSAIVSPSSLLVTLYVKV